MPLHCIVVFWSFVPFWPIFVLFPNVYSHLEEIVEKMVNGGDLENAAKHKKKTPPVLV